MSRNRRQCPRTCGLMVALGVLFSVTGCATHPTSGSGGTTTSPTQASALDLSGNWQFQPGAGSTPPFTNLSGFVNREAAPAAGITPLTTASLRIDSNGCFSESKVVDLTGYASGSLVQLVSIPTYSQGLALNLSTQCSGGVSACGTYVVSGGCADGTTGQITGVRFATLASSYQTATAVNPGMQVAVTAASQGTGDGVTHVSGALTFTGSSCVSAITLDGTQSYISGSSVHLVGTPDTAGAVVTADALIDSTATNFNLTAIAKSGSACLDPLVGARLAAHS